MESISSLRSRERGMAVLRLRELWEQPGRAPEQVMSLNCEVGYSRMLQMLCEPASAEIQIPLWRLMWRQL